MLDKVMSFLGGGFVKEVGGIIDDHTLSKEEKLESLVTIMASEMQAKERIIVSEMSQGDAYTKRARPTVVYFGLFAIGLNHVVLPWVQRFSEIYMETVITFPEITLPQEFWWAWTGVVSVWMVGRSAEKRGIRNSVTKFITGN